MNGAYPKVGCCGWRLSRPKYAERFPTVEVQQTFYDPPMLGTLKRWRASVPPDFEFTIKAWQLITHPSSSPTYRRLKTLLRPEEAAECGSFKSTSIVKQAWLATRDCAKVLGARLVLFQSPSSFTPVELNLEQMRSFFHEIDREGLRLLWEPCGDWPEHLIKSLCDELDLIHVVDPMTFATVTPEFNYVRWHGGPDHTGSHSDAQLRCLKELIGADRPAYVMFNSANMLDDATRFCELVHSARTSNDREFQRTSLNPMLMPNAQSPNS
jgi:uncharacterized protein YecE (DUF72 family)